MTIIRHLAMAAISAIMLSGCFTGVESTPKITASDVKRENVRTTPEQLWLVDVAPERFDSWEPGKEFYVTDNKITLALNPVYSPMAPLDGATIRYKGYREMLSVTGEMETELLFDSPEGIELAYRVNMSPTELASRSKVDIPFTIEKSIIDATTGKMKGKNLWILTSGWYDTSDRATHGRKFVQVTITDVLPGNSVYPVTLEFTPSDHPNLHFHLYMSVGENNRLMRSFAHIFSFTDPRKNYPAITDENWLLITQGRITAGMTRDECRLALGAPKDVDRRSGYSSIHEMWTYENGIYLIFEDGLLVRFRR